MGAQGLSRYALAGALVSLILAGPAAAATAATAATTAVPLTTLDGKRFTVADFAGRVVLLDFWATWCGPCREGVPGLKRLRDQMREQPFTLVSVSGDADPEQAKAFVAGHHMDWTQAWDGSGEAMDAFRVQGLPTYILLDPAGRLIFTISGWSPEVETRIRSEVERAVKAARGRNIAARTRLAVSPSARSAAGEP